MTDTVKSKSQLLTTDFVANAGTGAIGSQQFRNHVVSALGCYAALDETTLSSPEIAVTNSAWTEARTLAAGSPYTGSQSGGDTLTVSTTTGRITVPTVSGGSAAGTYKIRYHFVIQQGSTAVTLPDALLMNIRKNGTTALGGLSFAYMTAKPDVVLYAPAPLSATTTGLYVGGFTERFTATGLVLMAAALTDGTDYWSAIQVTNLGPTGSGTNTLFASAKTTTTGTTLTANVARVFAFDQNTTVAAGDVLKIVATKNASAPDLQVIGVRGRYDQNYNNEEAVYFLSGETEAALVAGDYVSVGTQMINTSGICTVKVRSAMFSAERVG